VKKTLLLVLCAVTTAAAFAQQPAGADRDRHHQDMRAKAEARFSASDRNHDGKLSLAEFQQARDQRLAEQFARLDANKDGGLSQDEMRQGRHAGRLMRASHRHAGMAMREKLRALDTDHDQALSRAEIGQRMPRLAQQFDRLDGNRDGKLSREELRAGRESLRGNDRAR
jgi:Ca2+-binding EF-hand superfamily protein